MFPRTFLVRFLVDGGRTFRDSSISGNLDASCASIFSEDDDEVDVYW